MLDMCYTLILQETPHTSPLRVSYLVFLWVFRDKKIRIMTRFYSNYRNFYSHWQNMYVKSLGLDGFFTDWVLSSEM